MDHQNEWIKKSVFGLLIIGAAFYSGFWTGEQGIESASKNASTTEVVNKENNALTVVDFSQFWKVWNIINEKYVATKLPTEQEKVYGAIQGLTASLGDPYTVFLEPEEKKLFEEEISGNFEGVGMEIGIKEDTLTVIAPLKGNPAERAGIRAGDKILKIDDVATTDMSTEKAVTLIRGKKGTVVRLTLFREGKKEPFEVSVVRDVITIPTLETEKRPDQIFVITLHNFSAVSVDLFRSALREFIEANTNKLIIDLRGNPGGYLEAAVDMASWFLPIGDAVVKEDSGKSGQSVVHRSRGFDIFNENLRLVILVDGGSASASEILAGALREHGKAKLVGEKTFGKGSVQELVKITDDTSLKVTVARWLTPDGLSISEGGLTPDFEVKMTDKDREAGKDPQLDKAVEILIKN